MKLDQILYRILFAIRKVNINKNIETPNIRGSSFALKDYIYKNNSTNNGKSFTFLNLNYVFEEKIDWNLSKMPKLWLYNLHYFDFINSKDLLNDISLSNNLIRHWIYENKSIRGEGWEPYTLSLRIVNWIKWSLTYKKLNEEELASLFQQTFFLSKNIEYHIYGNHLIANAKALMFAGIFFNEHKNNNFKTLGEELFNSQIKEQILEDGAHFELSPMYHQIIFEDILDIINIYQAFEETIPQKWIDIAKAMQKWARAMSHPDQGIAFFNDAAHKIAPSLSDIESYAARLGLEFNEDDFKIRNLKQSGYVIYNSEDAKLIFDCGQIGPDYIPGHGHADLFSIELSIFRKRLIVNGGTSTYEISKKRDFERSSAAHSTVEIDGKNSSEVWSSFRVARRAYPKNVIIDNSNDEINISALNDSFRGYLNERILKIKKNSLKIQDSIDGKFKNAISRLILHPEVYARKVNDKLIILRFLNQKEEIRVTSNTALNIGKTSYSPEFGKTIETNYIYCRFIEDKLKVNISW
tara:strand:+ start:311 stop:1879 length:1569 start_codon:yes stop_codon:yes gene_type:complete